MVLFEEEDLWEIFEEKTGGYGEKNILRPWKLMKIFYPNLGEIWKVKLIGFYNLWLGND
jgi:hypothetical protein